MEVLEVTIEMWNFLKETGRCNSFMDFAEDRGWDYNELESFIETVIES